MPSRILFKYNLTNLFLSLSHSFIFYSPRISTISQNVCHTLPITPFW